MRRSKYVDAALRNECAAVAREVPKKRNDRLNKAAFSLAQLIHTGEIDEGTIYRALEAAARACGLVQNDGLPAVLATITSGISAGLSKPRDIPEPRPRKGNTNGHKFRMTDAGWLGDCMRDDKGEPRSTLANALVALRNDPSLQDLFAYDEMLCAVLLATCPPWWDPGAEFVRRPVTDVEVGKLPEWLQVAGLEKLGKDTTHRRYPRERMRVPPGARLSRRPHMGRQKPAR